jgi:hypothetical protein
MKTGNIRRSWFVAGVIAAAALVLVAWLGFRSGSASDLQRRKAQLKGNGEKLTLVELGAGRWTNGDCMRVLTNTARALGTSSISAGNMEIREMLRPGEAVVSWKAASPPGFPVTLGWGKLTAQVDEFEPPLSDLWTALREPAEDGGPLNGLFGGRRIDFVSIRIAAQWLACASITELHKGNLDLALQDLEALVQMGQLNRSEYTLVAQMIRVAIGGLGINTSWEALQARGWSESQLAALQKHWESLDYLEAVETGFIGERAHGLELFHTVRVFRKSQLRPILNPNVSASQSGNPTMESLFSDYIQMPLYKATSIDSDELFYLNALEDSVEGVRMLEKGIPWRTAKQLSDAAMLRVFEIAKKRPYWRHMLSLRTIPNFFKATITALRTETERRMLVVAIALERFKLRNGVYPANLEALKPEFLSQIPEDPMSGKSLVYKLKSDGRFLLYSVGEDGNDDGGDASWTGGGRTSIWEAHDALWPSAAEDGSRSK